MQSLHRKIKSNYLNYKCRGREREETEYSVTSRENSCDAWDSSFPFEMITWIGWYRAKESGLNFLALWTKICTVAKKKKKMVEDNYWIWRQKCRIALVQYPELTVLSTGSLPKKAALRTIQSLSLSFPQSQVAEWCAKIWDGMT